MSTLAPRGAELADGPSLRELFGGILGDKYDKESNPSGMISTYLGSPHPQARHAHLDHHG